LAGLGEDAKGKLEELKESSFARKLTAKWKDLQSSPPKKEEEQKEPEEREEG
tara:strand:- start:52 stop:207 length:156 start_codon:yes stop_codon:yes gene_type:complete